MVGLGTMMQDPYGWVIDANGDPELYYFIGSVVGYPSTEDNGNVPQNALSQKLYKIKFNLNGQGQHDMNTSGTYPVGKIKPTLIEDLVQEYPPDSNDDNNTRVYGGLTFISRDVFLLGSSMRPGENENPPGLNTPVKTTLYANKLNAAGTGVSNTKIWNRKILKQGTTDSNDNNWPGSVSGFSFVPPESNLFDVQKKAASIVALTGCIPYGGPWSYFGGGNDTGQDHKNQILRLDTVDTAIGNNYYEASTSWRDSGTTSSWKLISQIGNGGVSPNADWDQGEGWMAFDSKGNMYYGSVSWYFGTSVGGPPYEPYGDIPPYQTSTPQYMHDVARINAPVSGGNANQRIMHFNSKLPEQTCDNGGFHYDWTNHCNADAGCCDIYGQSLYGKDSLWLFVNRNKKKKNCHATYNKASEGLWVIKRNASNDYFDILAHYELDDTGTDGWDNVTGLVHDASPSIGMSMLQCGMSFRPCAKRHV